MNKAAAEDFSLANYRVMLPMRVTERIGRALSACGIARMPLSESALLETARRKTGLKDFGDSRARIPLRLLLESFDSDPNLSYLGRLFARRTYLDTLAMRLRIEDAWKRYPQVSQQPIRRPLFIVGMPRTGTTLLHNLLSLDPLGYAPPLWQMIHPAPPPGRSPGGHDPRIRAAERRCAKLNRFLPGGAAVHPMQPHAPDECQHLFRNCFAGQQFAVFQDLPEYQRWCLTHDMRPEYSYYRRQLQLLAWQAGSERMILKWSGHALYFATLLEIFPDAQIVQTHRNPIESVASFCSLSAFLAAITNRRLDLRRIGKAALDMIHTCVERAIDFRRSTDESRFYDVQYDDLVRDPVATVREIHERFDYPYDERMQRATEQYMAHHPQNKHGRHRYELEPFGLTVEQIDDRFADYTEHYGLTPLAVN